MPITPIGSSGYTGNTNANSATEETMAKDDFLQMFVTQLKYQDPLNPMENTEFTAQMATFTQLEELQNMNTGLDNMLNSNLMISQSINNSLATTLIGKDVRTTGNQFEFTADDSEKKLHFNLSEKSQNVKVHIYNENNELVRTMEKSNMDMGDSSMEWDGKTDEGTIAGTGNYSYAVEAVNVDGVPIMATTFQKTRITGVKYIDGMANLVAGNMTLGLGQITEIVQPDS